MLKSRSTLCTHAFHRTDSKDPDIHVPDPHPARTINEDGMRLHQWLDDKTATHANTSSKIVNPRDIAGNAEEEEEEEDDDDDDEVEAEEEEEYADTGPTSVSSDLKTPDGRGLPLEYQSVSH